MQLQIVIIEFERVIKQTENDDNIVETLWTGSQDVFTFVVFNLADGRNVKIFAFSPTEYTFLVFAQII